MPSRERAPNGGALFPLHISFSILSILSILSKFNTLTASFHLAYISNVLYR
jgi:hypothetical protein